METPSEVLSSVDPGDDMQRRLRYQAAYGALVCLDLLVDDTIPELLCEQHEDFLIKKTTGKYVGVQVKTRAPHLGPLKSNDEPVVKALTKFIQLDIEFPGQFDTFVIVANCDFWHAPDNEKSLPHVLEKLRRNAKATFSGTMKAVISDIRATCKCKKERILEVLRRTRLEGNVPKFEDITGVVAIRIGKLDEFNRRYIPELYDCALALINHVLQASALTCDLPVRSHFVFATDPEHESVKQVINQKRITADIVLALLRSALQTAITLQTASTFKIEDLPLGHHLLERKMAAGGISFQSIEVAKDHQSSAEFLLQQWLYRYGPQTATDRYGQIDLMVRTQCAEAYDDTYSDTQLFGTQMLGNVRQRLKASVVNDADSLFGARYEHLLGTASLATQECKVWWSKNFDVFEEN